MIRAIGPATLFFAACALLAPDASAADWPNVPVPDGARGEVVSDDMTYNGLHMRASRFTVPLPIDKVKAFYRGKWGAGMSDTPHRGKSVLGSPTRDAKYYITVELSPAGKGTRGQIGVLELPKQALPENSIGAGFARMPDTVVAEDIVYRDTPAPVRTLSMVNRYSPKQNSDFYARTLAAKGYVGVSGGRGCVAASRECVSRYSNGSKRITVTSSRADAMTVIIAVVE